MCIRDSHYAVERAIRAQFGLGFRPFAALRRRRNELEYPERVGDNATYDEAVDAVGDAQAIIAAAEMCIRDSFIPFVNGF